MIIKINNKVITNDIKVIDSFVNDFSGETLDSLELVISDIENNFIIWNLTTDDTIELIKNDFSSGLMYIDTVIIKNGKCRIKATSLSRKNRELKNSTFENISFFNLCKSIASRLGLKLETYSIKDYSYKRIDQIDKTDLSFLTSRAILEGFRVKITNNKLVVYSENVFENYKTVFDYTVSDFLGNYEIKSSNLDTFSKCEIKYFEKSLIEGKAQDNYLTSSTLKLKIKVSDSIEAERFSYNLLKYKNKYLNTIKFCIDLNTNLAATSTIFIKNIGSFSGKYFIENIKHNFNNNKSYIYARKCD